MATLVSANGAASTTSGGVATCEAPEAVIRNLDDTTAIFVGDSGVTVSNGFPILPGEVAHVPIGASQTLYAVTPFGTANFRILYLEA